MTPKQAEFVKEYLKDLNATRAAERAGFKNPNTYAAEMMARHEIKAAIAAEMAKRAEKLDIDAEWVLRNAIDLHGRCKAEADRSNERQTLDLIGKHINVQAFKERFEHNVTVNLGAALDALDD